MPAPERIFTLLPVQRMYCAFEETAGGSGAGADGALGAETGGVGVGVGIGVGVGMVGSSSSSFSEELSGVFSLSADTSSEEEICGEEVSKFSLLHANRGVNRVSDSKNAAKVFIFFIFYLTFME